MLVAIFTLVGLTFPYLKKQLETPNTKIKATLLGISENEYHILLSNTGNRVGAIGGIKITEKTVNGFSSRVVDYSSFDIVKPENALKVTAIERERPPILVSNKDGLSIEQMALLSECSMFIDVVKFNGESVTLKLPFECVLPNNIEKWKTNEMVSAINKFIKDSEHPTFKNLDNDTLEILFRSTTVLSDVFSSNSTEFSSNEGVAELASKSFPFSDSTIPTDILNWSEEVSLNAVETAVYASMYLNLRQRVAEQLGVEAKTVKLDTHFINDLGADSLNIVELLMEFEDELQSELPDELCENLTSLRQVIEYNLEN
ncbi:MAG: hypothetical protein Alis3KO_15000 [Aliiglaciecola sp.]